MCGRGLGLGREREWLVAFGPLWVVPLGSHGVWVLGRAVAPVFAGSQAVLNAVTCSGAPLKGYKWFLLLDCNCKVRLVGAIWDGPCLRDMVLIRKVGPVKLDLLGKPWSGKKGGDLTRYG